jgi:hypothetical protein
MEKFISIKSKYKFVLNECAKQFYAYFNAICCTGAARNRPSVDFLYTKTQVSCSLKTCKNVFMFIELKKGNYISEQ